MRLVNWRALVIGAAGLGLAACGDDVTVTPTPISYTVSPQSGVTCAPGTSAAVGLTVSGGSGTPSVVFSAQNALITVTGSGTSATVVCGATAGASAVNFQITSGGLTASGSIPVTISGPTGSTVTAIQVNPTSASLVPGGTTTITATVTLAAGAPTTTSTAATFSSSDTTIARVTTNANGTATVMAVNTAANAGRQAVITAASVANPNLRAFTTITIAPASSVVSGIQVTPTTISLGTGATQQITAAVTLAAGAPAGTSTGVTYTSSDTSIARVSSTGLVTAGSRTGVATITVASVAAPTVAQQIAVTVTAPAPVRLTIQSLETVNAAGQQVAIDPTNVAGRLIATLNLDPGTFSPDSVVATLGGQRTVCQRFTAQLASALRASLTDGSADFAPIQCIINSSAFDSTSGVARVVNGDTTFTATVFYRPQGGGAGTQQSAQIAQRLRLNNASGYFINVTNTPDSVQVRNGAPANGQQTGPQGVLWRAGTLNVQVVPVFFANAPTGSQGTQNVSVSLQDLTSGQIAIRSVDVQAGTSGTVSFPGRPEAFTLIPNNNAAFNVNGAGCQCLTGYSSPNAGVAGVAVPGTQIVVGGTANTTILNSSGTVQAGAPVVYIDNAAPEFRAQTVSTNFLFGGTGNSGFLSGVAGSAFVFADSVRPAASTTVLADNNGVDRITRTFYYAANTTAISGAANIAQAIVNANQPVTTAATIAPANTQTSYRVAVRLADALGNPVAINVTSAANAANFTFGVDILAPTLTVTGVTNGGAGTTQPPITTAVSDNVGFGQNPITVILQQQTANGTFCAQAPAAGTTVVTTISTTAASGACTPVNAASVALTPGTTSTQAGIYTATIQARDIAGNLSPAQTFTYTVEATAPLVTNALVLTSPIAGNGAVTLRGTYRDSVRVDSAYTLQNFGPLSLRYDATAGSLPAALTTPFQIVPVGTGGTTANATVTIPQFIRALATTTGVAATRITGFQMGGTNAAGLNGLSTQAPIGTEVLLPFTPTTFATTNTYALTFTNGASANTQNVSVGGANPTSGTPSTGTFTATIANTAVPAATFASPFSRIDLYYEDVVGAATGPGSLATPNPAPVFRFLGTFSTDQLVVTPTTATRTATFAFSIPATLRAQATTGGIPVRFVALGVNANGDALVVGTLTTINIFQ